MKKPMYSMYSVNIKKQSLPDAETPQKNKTISRQIGGMKAQGSTSINIDIDGMDALLPKMEYVELLEMQVKELRERVIKLEKQLISTNNRIQRVSNTVNVMNMPRR